MAAIMNISGLTLVDDPSYRYKMPCMVTKIEGRGNGIKTVLCNIVDVAASLNRDAPEVTKFFGCELGSQTSFSSEEAGVAKAIVNGAQTTQVMQNHLKTYIEKFVLCKGCRLPEAHYKVKAGLIHQSCKACGAKEPVDMTHKLCTFILKAHAAKKDEKKKLEKADEKEDKKDKKDKKSKKDKETEEASSPTPDKEVKEKKSKDKEKDKDSSLEKEKKKEKKSKKDKEDSLPREGGDSDLPPHPPSDAIEDVSDKAALDDAIQQFRVWCDGNSSPPAGLIIAEKVRSLATMGSLRTADRYIILLSGLFTEAAATKNEVGKYKDILSVLLTNTIQQRQLIGAIEWFCGVKYPSLTRYFPVLLKQLFDADLVEEDVFFEWNLDMIPNDYSVNESLMPVSTVEQLKQNAQQFLTWLDEAEEEEGSGDEEEEEEDEEEN